MAPKNNSVETSKTDEKVAEIAVNQTGFGVFNIKIFLVCALICLNIGFGLGNIGLIIPSAACDFEMSTLDKGRIPFCQVFGMMFGPYFWAGLADTKGRKLSLISSLLIHGISDGLASIISNYWGFLICKFFNGFSVGAQIGLLFTYLGEFQPSQYRDRLLSWMELPWAFGLIITAGLGWAVLPMDLNYRSSSISFFFFSSWNLFLLICSIPSLLMVVFLLFLPETPKYLAESGQHAKLINVLCLMYRENTGLTNNDYLVKLKKLEHPEINELIISAENSISPVRTQSFYRIIKKFFKQTIEIMKPPHLKKTVLMSIVYYCVTAAYFIMVNWLPEIFRRFEVFEEKFPNMSASICTVSKYLYANNTQDLLHNTVDCSTPISNKVYLHNVILGATCLPVALWLPICVDKLGYKIHLIIASVLSSSMAFGLILVNNSTQNLILSCSFEALASVCVTILFCALVDLYPTHLRATAAAFTTFIGRTGAAIGIATVGFLIDNYCVTLISLVGTHLAVAAFIGFFLPIQKSADRDKPIITTNDVRKARENIEVN